jgi:hypothetical protein
MLRGGAIPALDAAVICFGIVSSVVGFWLVENDHDLYFCVDSETNN